MYITYLKLKQNKSYKQLVNNIKLKGISKKKATNQSF